MATTNSDTGSPEAIVREHFEAVWDDNTYHEELLAEDYTIRVASHEERTLEEMKAATTAFHEAFPDLEVDVEDVAVDDDAVVLRYRFTGTHEDEIRGIPPTGESVDVVGVGFFHVAEGELTDVWYVDDMLGLMQQLGAIPEGET